MIMGMFPAKQLNHEDSPSGPAISSVAPSGVVKNVMSDRHHNDQYVPENPYGHRIIYLRESKFLYVTDKSLSIILGLITSCLKTLSFISGEKS